MEYTLNTKQNRVIELIKEKKSLFITGPGGTGKTFLINHIAKLFGNVEKTALTGCAAVLIGGATTIHSWAGIGLGNKSIEYYVNGIRKNRKLLNRWRETCILIIDEVSMMTAELFSLLNGIAKLIRNPNKAFGGIQLLLFGDLYQLPPVEKAKGYIFDSEAYSECINSVVILDEIIRQKDPVWQRVLNKIRVGHCDDECISILNGKLVEGDEDELFKKMEIQPTLMYCKRANVDRINEEELNKLGNPIMMFDAKTRVAKKPKVLDFDGINDKEIEKATEFLDSNSQYQPRLKIAVGSQVMLTKNLDVVEGLVNGSRGVITGFTVDNIPVVKFKNGKLCMINHAEWEYDLGDYIVARIQIPLILAWATTIHKSQGQTLDVVAVDIGMSVFETGQAYTALSRVRELDGLYLLDFDKDKIKVSKKVCDFYASLE